MVEAEKKLRDYLEEIAKDNKYENGHIEVRAISSGGANYTSDLYLATISSPPKHDLKLFVKVANTGESLRAEDDLMTSAYYTERIFYTELAVAFNELYDRHGVPEKNRLYITKIYGFKLAKLEETLVLENLVAKGFGTFDRMKTFNWDYASAALGELAKFHALGLAFREHNQAKYEEIINKFSTDFLASVLSDAFIRQAEDMGRYVKNEYRDNIRKYLDRTILLKDMEKLYKKVSGGALVHGDYRPSNLMHRRRNGKMEIVPLDYQTVRSGKLVTDLVFFIWTSSDSQFRKLYYSHLLEHYYGALTQALRDLAVDVNKVYPRELFEQELEETKTGGLYIGLSMMPLLTVDPENAPNMDDLMNISIAPNQLAVDRMNDIIGDYVRRGVI